MKKEDILSDLKGMEDVYRQYQEQHAQVTKALEQQSGAIQYAKMLLAKIEKEEGEEKELKAAVPVVINSNSVPQEEM